MVINRTTRVNFGRPNRVARPRGSPVSVGKQAELTSRVTPLWSSRVSSPRRFGRRRHGRFGDIGDRTRRGLVGGSRRIAGIRAGVSASDPRGSGRRLQPEPVATAAELRDAGWRCAHTWQDGRCGACHRRRVLQPIAEPLPRAGRSARHPRQASYAIHSANFARACLRYQPST